MRLSSQQQSEDPTDGDTWTISDGIDVLLIEDNPNDAQFIERSLTEWRPNGEQSLQVGTVTRAERVGEIGALLEMDPDIVLLDLDLPDCDGIDAVETITERAPHIPVVVTGKTDTGLGPESIRAGAQDSLQKGKITADLLHRTLRYAIDRQRTQREIVELNRRLELLNRVVRQNVRDDVSLVVGRGDELHSRLDGDDERIADELVDSARHIVEQTDTAGELLSVLSFDADADCVPLDLPEILDRRVTLLQERSDADVTVQRRIDDGVTVEANPLLGTALEQLLSNALEHNDSERPKIALTVDSTPERVTITVADNGVGIPAGQRALLNDLDARYHERSGIGPGLYLAMTVVELSGGDVRFADNDSSGTAVTVSLPSAGSSVDSRLTFSVP